jgi:hypothetical protein
VVREDITAAALTRRTADRLLHMEELQQESVSRYLDERGHRRRQLLRASGFMGLLAAAGPWCQKLAFAESGSPQSKSKKAAKDEGRVHVVESSKETVQLGVFDTTLAPILKIDSGDTVSYTIPGRIS